MAVPTDRVYSESHEWHQVEGDTLTLGLTRFAVEQLTDVTFAEMKKPGTKFKAGEIVGEVESVKATSDIYSAAGGEIIEVNTALTEDPSLLNSDPYGAGWLLKARITDRSGLAKCMDAGAYGEKYG